MGQEFVLKKFSCLLHLTATNFGGKTEAISACGKSMKSWASPKRSAANFIKKTPKPNKAPLHPPQKTTGWGGEAGKGGGVGVCVVLDPGPSGGRPWGPAGQLLVF